MQTTSKLVLFKLVACVAAISIAVALPGYAQKGKGGGTKNTNTLTASFRDAGFNAVVPVKDRIASDCLQGDLDANSCPYVSGQENVSLGLGGNGNFILEVKDGRDFYLDFSAECAIGPCQPSFLSAGEQQALVGTTLGQRAKLFVVGLGSLAVGQSAALNAELLFSRLTDLQDNEEEVWWVTYRSNPPAVCPEGSSGPLMGSHPDATTWVVEAGPTDIGCLSSMWPKPQGDGEEEFHGAYIMPFKLTISSQP